MRSIRYRHNYTHVVIGEDGSVIGKSVTHDEICALRSNDSPLFLKFGGFVDFESVTKGRDQLVKLINITHYTLEHDRYCWEEVESGHYCVGVCRFNRYYMVLKGGRPIEFPIEPA